MTLDAVLNSVALWLLIAALIIAAIVEIGMAAWLKKWENDIRLEQDAAFKRYLGLQRESQKED